MGTVLQPGKSKRKRGLKMSTELQLEWERLELKELENKNNGSKKKQQGDGLYGQSYRQV